MHTEKTNDGPDVVRWGILGTGRIAREELAPAIREAEKARLIAIGSRSGASATTFADGFRLPRAHGDYRDLLADPEVDAVFIAVPNAMHEEWTIAALEAGKHVLCEKPLGMSADEVRRMAEAARRSDRVLMEGFMWRFHPRIQRVMELLADGAIGEVRLIRVTYALRNPILDDAALAAASIRLRPDLGGGALADLGSYCADALRLFAGADPVRVRSSASAPGGHPVETSVTGEIDFANGATGQLYASMETPAGAHLEIFGTAGSIRMSPAFRLRESGGDVAIRLRTSAGKSVETLPFQNQYRLEVEHFGRVVRGDEAPRIPLDDSLGTARLTDAIRRSWTEGTIELGPR
ncbi:Gfo/Idh/MocA family protein [Microbacterium tumbae]